MSTSQRRSHRTTTVNKRIFNEDFLVEKEVPTDESEHSDEMNEEQLGDGANLADDGDAIDVDIPEDDGELQEEMDKLEGDVASLKLDLEKKARQKRVLALRQEVQDLQSQVNSKYNLIVPPQKSSSSRKDTSQKISDGASSRHANKSTKNRDKLENVDNSAAVDETIKDIRKAAGVRSEVKAKLGAVHALF